MGSVGEDNTMDIEEYSNKKRSREEIIRKYDQAIGAREQLMKQIKEKFGCDTLEELASRIEADESKLSKLKQLHKTEEEAFFSEFGDRLNG